jgi:mannose-6-phosphate isomerase-like protein (cupin superfamily)
VEQPTHESATGRTWYLRTAGETGGALHEQRVEHAPGSPFPPMHCHPSQDEHFEIERGAMVFVINGIESTVAAGQAIDIPAGVAHKARNASSAEPAVVRWETRPALRTGEFFSVAHELGDAAGPLRSALLAHEYRDVFRASGLLGALVPILAAVARILRRRLPAPGAGGRRGTS